MKNIENIAQASDLDVPFADGNCSRGKIDDEEVSDVGVVSDQIYLALDNDGHRCHQSVSYANIHWPKLFSLFARKIWGYALYMQTFARRVAYIIKCCLA